MLIYSLKPFVAMVLIGSVLWSSGCAVSINKLVVQPVDLSSEGSISEGVRAHTVEGYVLIFPQGVQFTSEHIQGEGQLFGLNPEEESTTISSYPKAEIVAIEYVTTDWDKGSTAAITTLGLVSLFGAIGLVWVLTALGGGLV